MEKRFVDILEKHIKLWHHLKFTSTIPHVSIDTVNDLLIVFREYMNSKESVCKWCGDSISYLVKQVYQTYEKDAINPIMENVLSVRVEYPNGKQIVPATVPATKTDAVANPEPSQDETAAQVNVENNMSRQELQQMLSEFKSKPKRKRIPLNKIPVYKNSITKK